MKFKKAFKRMRCEHIIQPGEYVIDNWDGTQCASTTTMRCEYCGKYFCIDMVSHWHDHLDTHEPPF